MAPHSGLSVPDRVLWIFESVSEAPVYFQPGNSAAALDLKLNHLTDTIHGGWRAQTNLGPVELGIMGQHLIFMSISQNGRNRKDALRDRRLLLGLEMGRTYFGTDGYSGRIVGRLIQSIVGGSDWNWVSLGIYAGRSWVPNRPWSIQISGNLYQGISTEEQLINLRIATLRLIHIKAQKTIEFGGFLGWSQRSRELPTDGLFENIAFTFGPELHWKGVLGGTLKASITYRIWLDEQRNAGRVTYPSEFLSPDLQLAWRVAW